MACTSTKYTLTNGCQELSVSDVQMFQYRKIIYDVRHIRRLIHGLFMAQIPHSLTAHAGFIYSTGSKILLNHLHASRPKHLQVAERPACTAGK